MDPTTAWLLAIVVCLIFIILVMSVSLVIYRCCKRNRLLCSIDMSGIRKEQLRTDPYLCVLRNFMTRKECQHIIRLAKGRFKRSGVQASKSSSRISDVRTSYSAHLGRSEDDIVAAIEARAAKICGYPVENMEPLQVVRYQPGQFYKAHYDYFVPGAAGTESALRRGGQRHVTFFVYLNDLHRNDTGGHTKFPKLGLSVKPECGAAAHWWNIKSDGSVDDRTFHAGEPPVRGVKYGLNIWFREKKFV